LSNITNLNRDYLIKINVKEATIDVPKMTFWNTDKKTSNMFVQLVINMSENELIKNYVTIENATDYKITLNVIKPKTNQYRTFEAKLLNEEKALFEIDLTSEFIDQVGNYNFEFEVSSKVDNNDESITTSSSTYEVKGSILTNLNKEISSSPDLPILKQLIEQVKSLQGGDLTGYQKKSDNSLETTSKEIVGAINEVNSQYKDIAYLINENYFILKSPNGTQYKVKITDNGTLKVTGINEEELEDLLEGRLLIWHDEFEGSEIDRSKWRSSTNNSSYAELQAYTYERSENAYIENNQLVLKAIRENYINGYNWTSARLDTMGLFGVKYGRIEAKLKYESKNGAFPAFWTLGCNTYYPSSTSGPYGVTNSYGAPWPYCGELDIFEGCSGGGGVKPIIHYSLDPSTSAESNMTIATNSTVNTSEYHIYGVEWTETSMTAYLDGEEIGTIDTTGLTPYNKPHYLILNLALGSVAGAIDDDVNDIKMYVDWVRVYAPESVTQKLDITGITLSKSSMTMNINDPSQYVDYESTPTNTVNGLVTLTSSDTEVFKVYGTKLTAIAPGNAELIATSYNGITKSIPVQVGTNLPVYAESITLNTSNISISETKTATITATVKPTNCNETLSWSSNNTEIATVDNGIIIAKKAGNCVITVYSPHNNSIKGTCNVTVEALVKLSLPSNGLVLQLDRNGMNQYSWTNSVDNVELPWVNAYNKGTGANSAIQTDGSSFWWGGSNYSDYSMMDLSSYYDPNTDSTLILSVDRTGLPTSQDFIASCGSIGGANSMRISTLGSPQYFDSNSASIKTTGKIISPTGLIWTVALRFNATDNTYTLNYIEPDGSTNSTVITLASSYSTSEKFSLGVPGGKGKLTKFKVCAVYNRLITDEEVNTTLTNINEFVNS
jgi:beta-glucanase (GH16 family)